MKRSICGRLVCAFLITGSLSIFGQGSLTPLGAPAPTMKSLAQIAPRTPISKAPFIISTPGSYYLTQNLSVTTGDAITITTDNVTLDLNGFTISSTAASPTGTAILFGGSGNSRSNIAIFNGHIVSGVTLSGGVFSGSGFNAGIGHLIYVSHGLRVRDVTVLGVMADGIRLDSGNNRIDSCSVDTAGGVGMTADSVSGCEVTFSGKAGISATTVDNCYASSRSSFGITARAVTNSFGETYANEADAPSAGIHATTVQNCCGQSYGNGAGISADVVTNSRGTSDGDGDGINAIYAALNCSGDSAGTGHGLIATTVTNCTGENSGSGFGLWGTMANNCYGTSDSGVGLFAYEIAIGCFGLSTSGLGLQARIANSCHGTSESISFKYNMP